MEDIIEAVIDLAGDLLEAAFINIENPRKRKWALTAFYSAATLIITGLLVWGAVALHLEGNSTGAVAFAAVAGILFLVFGFFILRGHKSNWKNKKND